MVLEMEDICFKFVDGELKKVYHVSNDLYDSHLKDIKDWIDRCYNENNIR